MDTQVSNLFPAHEARSRHDARRGWAVRRLFSSAAVLAAVVGASLAASAAPAGAITGWTVPQRLLASDDVRTAMAIGPEGGLHVAVARTYGHHGIRYINDLNVQPATWGRDVDPAIAVGGGQIVIAFARLDPDTGISEGIYLATKQLPTGWFIQRVHHGVDRRPAIAIDDDGTIHLAFQSDGRLAYQRQGAGGWSHKILDDFCCVGSPSMRLGAEGDPVIAFSRLAAAGGDLALATRKPSGWSVRTLDHQLTRDPELVLRGGPHVAYERIGVGTFVWMYFASQASEGGSWHKTEVIEDTDAPEPGLIARSKGEVTVFGIRDERIVGCVQGNDYHGCANLPHATKVRSVEVEGIPNSLTDPTPDAIAFLYTRPDGLWLMYDLRY